MNPELQQYILQNRGTYTREAIDGRLLEAGHSQEQIEEAWAAIESGTSPPLGPAEPPPFTIQERPQSQGTDAPAYKKLGFWLTLIGFVLGLYGLFSLAAWLDPSGVSFWALPLVALIGTIAGSILLWKRNQSVAMGLITGCLVSAVLPFVFLVIISGLCLVGLWGPEFG